MAESVPGLGAINAPYGFKEIIPVTRDHRVRLPRNGETPENFRALTLMPVSYSEIPSASRDYPLIFVGGDQGKPTAIMAVTGLYAGHNLFVLPDGRWDPNTYIPAYVRRYPFCMMRIMENGKPRPERIACIEKTAVENGGGGEALHGADGKATADWEARQKLLVDYETDLVRTEEMCNYLADLGLFEPFTAQVTPTGEQPVQFTGMMRVIETKLATLEAAQVKRFVENGVMACIYAHLLSLRNFPRLLERHAARNGARGNATLN